MDEIERKARELLAAEYGCGAWELTDYEVRAAVAALRSAQVPEGWVSVLDRRPERNTMAVYWHRSDFGGFPAVADEWRDEHHLEHASHWHPGASIAPRGSDA